MKIANKVIMEKSSMFVERSEITMLGKDCPDAKPVKIFKP
jgi:hypothetical protein